MIYTTAKRETLKVRRDVDECQMSVSKNCAYARALMNEFLMNEYLGDFMTIRWLLLPIEVLYLVVARLSDSLNYQISCRLANIVDLACTYQYKIYKAQPWR